MSERLKNVSVFVANVVSFEDYRLGKTTGFGGAWGAAIGMTVAGPLGVAVGGAIGGLAALGVRKMATRRGNKS